MNAIQIYNWQCAKCDEVYDDEDLAEDCCEEINNDDFDDIFRDLYKT